MQLTPEELGIVRKVLAEHLPGLEVWAFGSRVHGRHLKPFSDLDLIVIHPERLDLDTYARIKTAFSDSELPFRVDVVSWAGTDERFLIPIKKREPVSISTAEPVFADN